jgi:hypothetical protein
MPKTQYFTEEMGRHIYVFPSTETEHNGTNSRPYQPKIYRPYLRAVSRAQSFNRSLRLRATPRD